MMKVYRTAQGAVLEIDGLYHLVPDFEWDALFVQNDLPRFLRARLNSADRLDEFTLDHLLAPIAAQEVWAAGVTYLRSRTARIEESEQAGGGSFYDKVYEAERPELFFKATAYRTSAHQGPVAIRPDSSWTVPEPELALVVGCRGQILGYAIGNDMSARDIEGENPLYLPQAKVYDGCCSLGPGILVREGEQGDLPSDTVIELGIERLGREVFRGTTRISEMRRRPEELIEYLFRQNSFPSGCFLLTGTGIVPPSDFRLEPGDQVRITIEPIGTLMNPVVQRL
jgi:2-dehydro-3-deoxy-D-arabinonate dehydratase